MSSYNCTKPPLAILFDMGDTLIHEQPPDFTAGVEAILGLAAKRSSTGVDEISREARELLDELLLMREKAMIEISCGAYLKLLGHRFGLVFNAPPEALEKAFRQAAFQSVSAPGIEDVVALLEEYEIRRAVLSNSIFSGLTLEEDLQRLKLRDAFEFVMSSAEYCVRKPHRALFLAAAGRLGLEPSDIWYAGDLWDCDMAGASAVGMQTLWYNPTSRKCPVDCEPSTNVASWKDFCDCFNERFSAWRLES